MGSQINDYHISSDSDFIRIAHQSISQEVVLWKDIESILIKSIDTGQAEIELWIHVTTQQTTVRFPVLADGFEGFLKNVSALSGFDFKNFTEAMSSTENATFALWTNTED